MTVTVTEDFFMVRLHGLTSLQVRYIATLFSLNVYLNLIINTCSFGNVCVIGLMLPKSRPKIIIKCIILDLFCYKCVM
jgi:hypothetical protein